MMKEMKGVKVGTIGSGTLKDHFEDIEIIDALKSTYLVSNDATSSDINETSCNYWPFTRNESRRLLLTNPDERKLHPLTVGLVLKLRNGLFRITRRTRLKVIQPPHDTTEGIFSRSTSPLDHLLTYPLTQQHYYKQKHQIDCIDWSLLTYKYNKWKNFVIVGPKRHYGSSRLNSHPKLCICHLHCRKSFSCNLW